MGTRPRQIVFVESAPTDMLAKMALLLRRKGYETVLISLLESDKDFLKQAYSRRIDFNFRFFKAGLKQLPSIASYAIRRFFPILTSTLHAYRLHPYVVIGRATPSWFTVLVKKFFRQYPFIYFPYDIRSFCYIRKEEAVKLGVPAFELAAEKYCFENSDGVIHKGDKNELRYLDSRVLGKKIKIPCPTLHFLPYCFGDFIVPISKIKKISERKKKEIHIVFVGHVGREKEWIQSVEMIVNQGIYLHLYGKTAYLDKNETYSQVGKDYNRVLKNPYFKLHEPVDQSVLAQEISQYDYGIWLGYHNVKRKNITIATGNKLASYLEAALPIIHYKHQRAINRIIMPYGAGIPITFSELKNLKNILSKHNPREMMHHAACARNALLMEKHLPRLETFFDDVCAYQSQKK